MLKGEKEKFNLSASSQFQQNDIEQEKLYLRKFWLLLLLFFYRANYLHIASRSAWGAVAPKSGILLPDQLRYVSIHHSFILSACFTELECQQRMRFEQHMHMVGNGWDDIGYDYNFAIGGDGRIYQGRGYGVQGAHTIQYNNDKIGAILIGDWSAQYPSSAVTKNTDDSIAYGVGKGYIRSDYDLYGHKQLRPEVECPGNTLFEQIKSWVN